MGIEKNRNPGGRFGATSYTALPIWPIYQWTKWAEFQCVKERHSFERHSRAPLLKWGAKEECHSFFSKGAMWEWHSFFCQGAVGEWHSLFHSFN